MKTKTFLLVILALLVGACTQESTEIPKSEPVPVATSTIHLLTTETASAEPITTVSATVAATITSQAKMIDFKNIKSGQYVIVGDFGRDIPFLYIISTDQQIIKSISLESYLEFQSDIGIKILKTHFDTSSDGTQFLIMRQNPNLSYLLDVSTGEQTSLSLEPDCRSASWSPDKKFIALSCINDVGMEIFILDVASKQILQVTNCHASYHECYSASWSTNGNWVAYYQSDERSGEHPRGIMMFNTSCFMTNDCSEKQMGPIAANSNPTWSLQNQLVYMQSGMISYIEVKNRQYEQVRANLVPELNYNGRTSDVIEFSPDGTFIACLSIDRASIYLYSPSLNKSVSIFSSQNFRWLDIIGWVTIQ
jgi:WD40 repeat protein